MKRYSSAPSLSDEIESKRARLSREENEPNAKEYLQLALARVLQLQREIKEGTYASNPSDNTSDLGDSSSDEDVVQEVVGKVFEDLPGTTFDVEGMIKKLVGPRSPQLDAIRSKQVQLLGYETCRRTAIEFMKNSVRSFDASPASFRVGTFSKREPKVAHRRTGLRNDPVKPQGVVSHDYEVRLRMLRSLDLHLAAGQRDYTARLMSS